MAWYEAFITLKITDWYNLQAFITLKLLTGITSRLWPGMKPLLP